MNEISEQISPTCEPEPDARDTADAYALDERIRARGPAGVTTDDILAARDAYRSMT